MKKYEKFRVTSESLYLRNKGCTGFPVMDDEKVAGIISRRDFKKMNK